MVGASLALCEALAGCFPACGGFPSLGGGQGVTRALTPNQLPSPAYLENGPFIWVDGETWKRFVTRCGRLTENSIGVLDPGRRRRPPFCEMMLESSKPCSCFTVMDGNREEMAALYGLEGTPLFLVVKLANLDI